MSEKSRKCAIKDGIIMRIGRHLSIMDAAILPSAKKRDYLMSSVTTSEYEEELSGIVLSTKNRGVVVNKVSYKLIK